MAIIRVSKDKDNPFVMINKQGLDNKDISFKAKGILSYLLSKPDDWRVYENELSKASKNSRHSVRTGIQELIEHGYIVRKKNRTEEGQFAGYDYTVYETNNRVRFSDNGKSDIGEPDTTNNNLTNNKDTNIYIILPDDGHVFIEIYKDLFRKITKKEHVRVTEKQLSWIIDTCDSLVSADVTKAEFTEAATEHLQNLPKSNNGNIIAFLHAAGRYFEYDAVNQRQL